MSAKPKSGRLPERERPLSSSDAARIEAAIDAFDPAMVRKIRAARAAVRKRFPTAFEMIYDSHSYLVIAFCTSERPASSVMSLAANAKGISLHFFHGADLPDPDGLLQGSGKQNRFVRLQGPASLKEPGIARLVDAAEAFAAPPFRETGSIVTILRAVSPKQQSRRNP